MQTRVCNDQGPCRAECIQTSKQGRERQVTQHTVVECSEAAGGLAQRTPRPWIVALKARCTQACTEARYHEFRKHQLSLRTEARALVEPKDASTPTRSSAPAADWTPPPQSSSPANATKGPQSREALAGPVSVPEPLHVSWI